MSSFKLILIIFFSTMFTCIGFASACEEECNAILLKPVQNTTTINKSGDFKSDITQWLCSSNLESFATNIHNKFAFDKILELLDISTSDDLSIDIQNLKKSSYCQSSGEHVSDTQAVAIAKVITDPQTIPSWERCMIEKMRLCSKKNTIEFYYEPVSPKSIVITARYNPQPGQTSFPVIKGLASQNATCKMNSFKTGAKITIGGLTDICESKPNKAFAIVLHTQNYGDYPIIKKESKLGNYKVINTYEVEKTVSRPDEIKFVKLIDKALDFATNMQNMDIEQKKYCKPNSTKCSLTISLPDNFILKHPKMNYGQSMAYGNTNQYNCVIVGPGFNPTHFDREESIDQPNAHTVKASFDECDEMSWQLSAEKSEKILVNDTRVEGTGIIIADKYFSAIVPDDAKSSILQVTLDTYGDLAIDLKNYTPTNLIERVSVARNGNSSTYTFSVKEPSDESDSVLKQINIKNTHQTKIKHKYPIKKK